MRHNKKTLNVFRIRGISLIEFMVSILISLLILSGILASLNSMFQTRMRRAELETAAESYRFLAQTMTTLIKNACSVGAASNSSTLILNQPDGTTDTITYSSGTQSITIDSQAAVDRVFGLTFSFGESTNVASDRISDGEYSASFTSASNVRSIRITVNMLASGSSQGITESFIATLRAKVLPQAQCT